MDKEAYFELYNTTLKLFAENHFSTSDSFRDYLSKNEKVIKLRDNFPEKYPTNVILDNVITNLIEDGLIRGKLESVVSHDYYIFYGQLTTKGINYLAVINSNTALEKIKKALHDEGIPLTPASASKFMGKVFF